MARLTRRTIRKKPGTAPGTLVHVGERRADAVRITVMDYSPDALEEREVAAPEACAPYREAPSVTWINVDGLHDVEVVRKLGEEYGLHPLVLEDLLSTGQRPKLEEYDRYAFLVVRALTWDDAAEHIQEEQVSLVLGDRWVLSFQERPGDVFDPVRERIRATGGRIRGRGADYLVYALVDAVVDHYFAVLERIGDRIGVLEEELIEAPGPETLGEIHRLKRELLYLRKSVWPLREVLSALQRHESGHVTEETRVFLRDVYDHTIQVIDTAETFRDMVSGMLDIYLSSLSHKMNETMKVLTVIATIFIPLTFVAGVYGMNFEWMPELDRWWAYPAVLLVMLGIALSMLVYFRRRGWL